MIVEYIFILDCHNSPRKEASIFLYGATVGCMGERCIGGMYVGKGPQFFIRGWGTLKVREVLWTKLRPGWCQVVQLVQ